MRGLSLFKTLYFNLYYLPLTSAYKMPFRIGKNVKIGNMGKRDSVKVLNPNRHIGIGTGQSFALGQTTFWSVGDQATVIIRGGATIGRGSQIIVNGTLDIGDNFYCNANCIINAAVNIDFGSEALLGWNVTVIDGDGHTMVHGSEEKSKHEEIKIGNHVWLAAHSSVLKGSKILNNSVVAYGAVVSKKMTEENILIAGQNQIIRTDVDWRK